MWEQVASIEQVAEGRKGLFTVETMHTAMPLDVFCQIIGSGSKDAHVQQAMLDGVPLGKLPLALAASCP